jgi:type IV secretion system protein VirB4
VQLLQDGRRGYCIFEEFSKTIGDKAFAKFGKEGLERWRKNDWGCAFVTQSTSTVNSSEIARVLIENTATKILFPNEEAQKVDYIDSFGATEREYILVKEVIEPGSRQFIVKQAKNSVVCELDLKGFNFELDVISGRKKNVQIVRDTIGQVGDDPDDWLPLYEQRLLSENGERA